MNQVSLISHKGRAKIWRSHAIVAENAATQLSHSHTVTEGSVTPPFRLCCPSVVQGQLLIFTVLLHFLFFLLQLVFLFILAASVVQLRMSAVDKRIWWWWWWCWPYLCTDKHKRCGEAPKRSPMDSPPCYCVLRCHNYCWRLHVHIRCHSSILLNSL